VCVCGCYTADRAANASWKLQNTATLPRFLAAERGESTAAQNRQTPNDSVHKQQLESLVDVVEGAVALNTAHVVTSMATRGGDVFPVK
jgi:hypothetical protein